MMSSSCTGSECSIKIAEYKNGIDKLLKRLRDSENQKSEYEIINLTLKQKLNRPSKVESKHFQHMFDLIQTLIDDYFGKIHKKDSIKDVFLGMIDSIWSLLAARYSDVDSWLDLKYLGTNVVESLTNFELPQPLDNSKSSNEHVYETLSNLKKSDNFQKEANECLKPEFNKMNFDELNKEIETLKKETLILNEKIKEQNTTIKSLLKSFSKQIHTEKKLNSSINTTTASSSSGRLSSCGNEISSGSFNSSSQGTNMTVSSSCPSEKNIEIRRSVRSLSVNREVSTMACPTCKLVVDFKRCSMEKFEKHVLNCKDNYTNGHLKETGNDNNILTQRKHSGSSSMASNSSSNSTNNSPAHNPRRSSDTHKNYMIIQSFEPKSRKRL